MIRDKDTLKSWFVTGAYPTQQQFWDWMDSYIHQSDGIRFDDISGMADYFNQRNQELLTEVNNIVTQAADNIKLARPLTITMEKSSQDVFFGEAVTINYVEAQGITSLTMVIDEEETEIPVNEPVAIDIPYRSVVWFNVTKTDTVGYLYIKSTIN
jgi:hypothetical protein